MLKSFIPIIAVPLVAAALAYLVSDTLAARFLAVAFIVYAISNFFHISALYNWSVLRDKRELPSGLGTWSKVFSRLRNANKTDLETKQEIREEFDRIQAVVDHLPDGLVVLDQYDHILWYNNAARELHEIFGFKRPIHHFIRQPEFFTYLTQPSDGQTIKLNLATRPGRLFEVRVVASSTGQRLLITRDITEASKIDVMRRDFVANVSHEIRTPVTVIGGFAETLLSLELDAESKKSYLNTILSQSQTMQRLLQDLLTLSSLESGSDVAVKESVDMPSLLETLVAEARTLSNGRHEVTLRLDGPRTILGASTEIETAARNLIVNALRYTPDGGKVDVSWQGLSRFELPEANAKAAFPAGAQAWLRVQDTGPGIAEEHLPRLTERFYRVDRARSRDTGGTGLGLAIVKHVAQRHQAELVIESEFGKGSRFSIGFHAPRIGTGPGNGPGTGPGINIGEL
jgi:two-component system, OmpR family, phosphate regulon sensor histidine kinase PhoR